MTIEKNLDGSTLTIALFGRLDTSSAPELEKTISGSVEGVLDLVLDFKEIEYISSAGLRTILAAQKMMEKKDGTLVVRKVSETVQEIFDVTGFSSIITIE